MSERRPAAAAAVSLLLISMLLVAAYFGGYFALSVKHSGATPDDWCRIFRSPWLTKLYQPAARVESVLTGDDVCTSRRRPSDPPWSLRGHWCPN